MAVLSLNLQAIFGVLVGYLVLTGAIHSSCLRKPPVQKASINLFSTNRIFTVMHDGNNIKVISVNLIPIIGGFNLLTDIRVKG